MGARRANACTPYLPSLASASIRAMFNSPVTELTTAATDALLGTVCLALVPAINAAGASDPWRATLWAWVFILLAAASFLGTIVHGLALSPKVRDALWQPLFLALGIVVALFVVGATRDWLGDATARRVSIPAVLVGVLFWGASRALGGSFRVFVVYEAVAMSASLAIYVALACGQGLPGAATIAAAIVLTLVASGLQASALEVTIAWPFDHNSLFHLVQLVAMVLLQHGVRAGLAASAAGV
jgi:hypothetical protein